MAIIYSYPIATPQDTDLLIISRTPTDPDEISNYSVNMSSVADYVIDEAFNGTDRYIPRFDGTSSLVNSVIYEDSNSNIGIGTTSPSQKLHVAGNLRVTGAYYDSTNSPGTSGQILSSTATGTDWIDGSAIPGVPDGSGTAGKIVMWQDSDTLTDSKITQTAGSETNYVDVDFANVEDLTITGDSGFSTFTVSGFDAVNFTSIENNFNVGSADLAIATNDNSMNLGGGSADSDTLTVGYPTTRFIGTGNVGIGTTSPSAKLHISESSSASTANLLYLENTGSGGSEGVSIKFNPVFSAESMIASNREGAVSNASNLTFHTATSDTTTERMRITSDGNVGIGTTSPVEKLHVVGSALIEGSSTELKVKGSGSYDTANITMGNAAKADSFSIDTRNDPGDNKTTLSFDSYLTTGTSTITLGDNYVNLGTASSTRLVINSSGNVGIGTTSPVYKLDVTGDIRSTFNVRANANVIAGGDIEIDDSASGLILRSPNGTRYRVQVDNSGNLTTTAI